MTQYVGLSKISVYDKLPDMGFFVKFIAKVILNGIAFYLASIYFPGFILAGGIWTLIIAALVFTIINTFIRPILRLITAPLVWVTFGLFNLVINMLILWMADRMLNELTITDLSTLFWVSIIIALANAFF